MTSFAFILGCVPLWTASGSGAVARQILGTTVIGGMLAASLIAVFLIPVSFYLVGKFCSPRILRSRSKSSMPSKQNDAPN
jgi:HAE1 family hydrophobic/amphiphilic exporter-1